LTPMAGGGSVCTHTQLARPALHCAPCLRRRQSVQRLRRQCTAVLTQANGDTLLAASQAASVVSRFVDLVATASPAPLQPAVNVIGMDIASTVALQPTMPGVARLAVRALCVTTPFQAPSLLVGLRTGRVCPLYSGCHRPWPGLVDTYALSTTGTQRSGSVPSGVGTLVLPRLLERCPMAIIMCMQASFQGIMDYALAWMCKDLYRIST